MDSEINYILKKYWGFNDFRENQYEIIKSIIEGNNTIALLPTGGGKSLCFQLPAVALKGLCIVISPLLALMKDQVSSLNQNGISARYISSELSHDELQQNYALIENSNLKILYISPERIHSKAFIEFISKLNVSFIAIDEAHCISEWGNDFRPSYQNISFLKLIFPNVKFIALTATATSKVIMDIQNKLDLNNVKIFKSSFSRSHFHIKCLEIGNKHERLLQELKMRNDSGIIYVRTRKDAESIVSFLQQNNITNVGYYHAGLQTDTKSKLQELWKNSDNFVLVSTNAFGMGIDKSNVRFVIHFSAPNSIENYYQEIGRAGRDGKDSYSLCLWNNFEFTNLDNQLFDQIPTKFEFKKIYSSIYSFIGIAENDKSIDWHQINFENFIKTTNISRNKIKNTFAFLNQKNILEIFERNDKSSIEVIISTKDLDIIPKEHAYMLEKIIRFLPGVTSQNISFRKEVLVNKFKADWKLISIQLKDFQKLNYIKFVDGDSMMIKTKTVRNEHEFMAFQWPIFYEIQKNKIKKWEEMKYFVKHKSSCRMKMILAYFDENAHDNCSFCDYCLSKNPKNSLEKIILDNLENQNLGLDEFCILIHSHTREEILDELYILLDNKKIKMFNFKTYSKI